MAQIKANIVFT